jgi:tripartite-type tricarboxylate transporter receptor subunit TctC
MGTLNRAQRARKVFKQLTLGSFLAVAGFCTAALAQAPNASYPTKSITMIVPFPPGGLADIVARPVAEAMSQRFRSTHRH